jgi:hypothetical protein
MMIGPEETRAPEECGDVEKRRDRPSGGCRKADADCAALALRAHGPSRSAAKRAANSAFSKELIVDTR